MILLVETGWFKLRQVDIIFCFVGGKQLDFDVHKQRNQFGMFSKRLKAFFKFHIEF